MTTPTTVSNAGELKRTARELLAETVLRESDPLLSINFVLTDLGITRWLFNKAVLPSLPLVRVSTRKAGVRRSVYENWKASRTKPVMVD